MASIRNDVGMQGVSSFRLGIELIGWINQGNQQNRDNNAGEWTGHCVSSDGIW
jgi:hypothetical protein